MSTTAVLGAGGKTGKECVNTLLSQGKAVRAIVRDPSKYKDDFPTDPKLELVAGDVTNVESLKSTLTGVRSVIFAASGKGFWSAKDIDCNGVKNVADVAKTTGVQHIVLVSSCLVTPTWSNRLSPIRILLNNIRWGLMDYKYKGEDFLRKSGVAYTVVRPGGLSEKPAGQVKLIARQGDNKSGMVSRADVAAVCVAALGDPAAKNVTLELISDTKAETVAPLSEQLKSIFSGLKADTTSTS